MNQDTKKRNWKKRFSDNDFGLRLLVALIFLFALTVFMHFREVKIEVLELNARAGKYIVGQVDFEFPDEEATIVLKQEAIRDIGALYKIDDQDLRKRHLEFENYLNSSAEWRKNFPDTTFEEMYNTADVLVTVLERIRFADRKTIRKIEEIKLSTESFVPFKTKENEEKIFLPGNYWRDIEKKVDRQLSKRTNESLEVIDFIVEFFQEGKFQLVRDVENELRAREVLQKNIPYKYSKVKAGTKIIDQGELVSSKHIAMVQAMKDALSEQRKLFDPLTVAGNVLFSLVLLFFVIFYFRIDQREILRSLQKLSLLVCILILTLAFAKITEYILLHNPTHTIESIRYPIIVPFAAILLTVLFNYRAAIFGSFFLAIIMSVTLAFDHSRFLIVNSVAALVVIVTTKSLRKRKEVFGICVKCFFGVLPVIFSFSYVQNVLWSKAVSVDITSSLLFLMIIAVFVVGLLPILESLFNVLTDITLMEYMDPNNELLKQMMMEIPGTYQHSLVLGNLSEAAAQAIGANGLLCKVGTLYHDIGKLNNPYYFTENQQMDVNIHQLLTPAESAQVIVSHVKDGEILAKKYRLPQPIIDIIKEHHGTTLVYYFYYKELELKGGDKSKVDEDLFRYPGPKPQRRESAIVMIADAVEAASRSQESITEETLTGLVDQVVSDRADDGQFDECNLTFEELKIVKKSLIKMLLSTRHLRIKYPEKK